MNFIDDGHAFHWTSLLLSHNDEAWVMADFHMYAWWMIYVCCYHECSMENTALTMTIWMTGFHTTNVMIMIGNCWWLLAQYYYFAFIWASLTIGGQQWNLSSCLLAWYFIPYMAESLLSLSANQHYIKHANAPLNVNHNMWAYHSSANHKLLTTA